MALRARKLYEKDWLTLKEVGEKCGGRSDRAIAHIFEARGWPRRSKGFRPKQQQLTIEMYDYYLVVRRLADVATRYSCSIGNISKRFAMAGLCVQRHGFRERD